MSESDYLTAEELSQLADAERSYIRRVLARGVIPGAHKRAGVWLIPAEAGREWALRMAARQAKRRAAGKPWGRPRKSDH